MRVRPGRRAACIAATLVRKPHSGDKPVTHHPIAPNAADVEVATATDPIETVVNVIPVVIPAVGAIMIFLLAMIAVFMA